MKFLTFCQTNDKTNYFEIHTQILLTVPQSTTAIVHLHMTRITGPINNKKCIPDRHNWNQTLSEYKPFLIMLQNTFKYRLFHFFSKHIARYGFHYFPSPHARNNILSPSSITWRKRCTDSHKDGFSFCHVHNWEICIYILRRAIEVKSIKQDRHGVRMWSLNNLCIMWTFIKKIRT